MEITSGWGGGGWGREPFKTTERSLLEEGGGGVYGRGLVCVVVFGVAVAWWEAPLRLVTQHYSDCRTMGDGRRASPSCRPWKSRKTRFRTGRVLSLCRAKGDLHSLRGWWRGGALCVCVCVSGLPFLISPALWGCSLFSFLHSFKVFSFQGMCAESNAALGGVQERSSPEET